MKKVVGTSSLLIAFVLMVACTPNQEAANDSIMVLTQEGFGAAVNLPEETAEPTLEVRVETLSRSEPTEETAPTIMPTQIPATAVPVQRSNISSNEIEVAQTNACTLRTDWQTYIVSSGDTLSSLAVATRSTTVELVAANCLANANNIVVGQRLYVPNQPIIPVPPTPTYIPNTPVPQPIYTVTPTATLLPFGSYGSIIVDGAIRIETTGGSKRFVFLPNSLVTLGWVDYPKNPVANSIDFVYMPADRWATPQVIGTDTDITDGVSIIWQMPDEVMGKLMVRAAVPHRPNEYIFSQEVIIVTDHGVEPPTLPTGSRSGALAIDPAIQAGNPDDWNEYILQAGAIVTIHWSGYGPTMTQDIESAQFIYRPSDGTGETIIGVDSNIGDGSVTSNWVVPLGPDGHVYVKAFRYESAGAGYVLSPELHIIPQE